MAAAQVIQDYFAALGRKKGWESFLADDLVFTSYASPNKRLSGKEAYLAGTKRFFSMVSAVEVRELIVDGAKACALTRYELQTPAGRPDRFAQDLLRQRAVPEIRGINVSIRAAAARLSVGN